MDMEKMDEGSLEMLKNHQYAFEILHLVMMIVNGIHLM